jgi:transcriptional regulator GlxA family with amidase domain
MPAGENRHVLCEYRQTMKDLPICILAFHDCMAMEVFALYDTIRLANRVAGALPGTYPLLDVRVIGLAGSSVVASGGLRIGVERPPKKMKILLVPGVDLCNPAAASQANPALARETEFIARTFQKGTEVASVCAGAFLLGDAGLLDDRRVTTAWILASLLGRRFPRAQVEPDNLLIEDGGVTTSAAYSAALNLSIHLVRRWMGAAVATALARTTLVDATRTSQAPYMDARVPAGDPHGFAHHVDTWLSRRIAEPIDVGQMAQAFKVSERTLLRRFRSELQSTPLARLQVLRIELAKKWLASTAMPVADIVQKVGYSDASSFGRLFRREVSLTPAEYRGRFRS